MRPRTGASLAMLDGYRTRDVRIRVIDHPENSGLSAARNTGWRAARSEYIVLLDSDDLLEPTAVEKWFWHLATFPEHAFVKGFGVGFGAQEYLWQRGFHENEAFLEENIVDATSMVRRSVLETGRWIRRIDARRPRRLGSLAACCVTRILGRHGPRVPELVPTPCAAHGPLVES